jgi:CxxC motif-containing protein
MPDKTYDVAIIGNRMFDQLHKELKFPFRRPDILRDELTNPKRTVTAVISARSADWPCVPVRTSEPVPRKIIPDLLKALYAVNLPLPVVRGQKIISDFNKTGVDVICTRSLPPHELRKRK